MRTAGFACVTQKLPLVLCDTICGVSNTSLMLDYQKIAPPIPTRITWRQVSGQVGSPARTLHAILGMCIAGETAHKVALAPQVWLVADSGVPPWDL